MEFHSISTESKSGDDVVKVDQKCTERIEIVVSKRLKFEE